MSDKKEITNHSNTSKADPKNQIYTSNYKEDKLQNPKSIKKNVFLSRVKRKILKHTQIVRAFIIILVIIIVLGIGVWVTKLAKDTSVGFYYNLAKNFVLTPEGAVSSINGRVSFLILGKGGEGHEAPDLTDTIIFASVSRKDSEKIFGYNSSSKLSLVSLPRDIWNVPLRTKLNSVYYWGNQKQPNGGGLVLAKSVVEEVVGQPIQYGVVVDFSGFKRIIDVLGGIDVDVQNGFVDNDFPVLGRENDTCGGDPNLRCRFETVSFEKGVNHMNGETALKFVRSRQAEGDEGTDFARAARQEKVLEAIKRKVFSREIYMNPKKLLELKDTVLSSIETDITAEEFAVIARWVIDARDSVSTHVIPENLLENPPKLPQYDNLYVFVPKEIDESDSSGRSWIKVQEWIGCVISMDVTVEQSCKF